MSTTHQEKTADTLAGNSAALENEQTYCAETGGDVKTLATLTAKLALLGYSLHRGTDGSFTVSRWNLSKPLPDLDAVQSFLRQVGGD